MRSSPFLLVCLHCICGLVSPEEHDRERRDLSMLRMGKRGMEVLPARAIELPPLVPPNYDAGDEFEERELIVPDGGPQVWVPRMGKDMEYEGRYVRHPPFPRMGMTFEDFLKEFRRDVDDEELRQLFLKYPHVSRRKRSIEAAEEPSENTMQKRATPFPRLGLMERAFPRIGLRDFDDEEYTENEIERALPFPRMGLQERALPLPRMGYRDVDKKAMGMLRMGRSDENALADEEEKRAMSMLRMGKRAMGMLRMGKRPVSMLRMGRSQDTSTEEEKRAMGMLRMGKRAMGMLRMGRSDGAETDEEKRAMSMLRMGKRGMSMLRMGRSDNSEVEEKRAMGMLRMGRGMSMLRMGRSGDTEPQEQEKRAMSMLRMGKRPVSMLRMGKRDTDHVQSAIADQEDSIAKTEES